MTTPITPSSWNRAWTLPNIGWKSYAALTGMGLTLFTIYKTHALFCARATFLRAQKAWDKTNLSFEIFKKIHDAKQSYDQALQYVKSQETAYNQAFKDYNQAVKDAEAAGRNAVNVFPGTSATSDAQETYRNACDVLTQKTAQQTKLQQSLNKTSEKKQQAEAHLKKAELQLQDCLRLNNQYKTYLSIQSPLESLLQAQKAFHCIEQKSSTTVRVICRFVQFFLARFGMYNPP